MDLIDEIEKVDREMREAELKAYSQLTLPGLHPQGPFTRPSMTRVKSNNQQPLFPIPGQRPNCYSPTTLTFLHVCQQYMIGEVSDYA